MRILSSSSARFFTAKKGFTYLLIALIWVSERAELVKILSSAQLAVSSLNVADFYDLIAFISISERAELREKILLYFFKKAYSGFPGLIFYLLKLSIDPDSAYFLKIISNLFRFMIFRFSSLRKSTSPDCPLKFVQTACH
jgi:hypothetical protein